MVPFAPIAALLEKCSRLARASRRAWRGDESNGLARPVNMPLKTILVLVVAIATFNLGRYSVEFSAVACAAVISCLVILAISLFALLFWRPGA